MASKNFYMILASVLFISAGALSNAYADPTITDNTQFEEAQASTCDRLSEIGDDAAADYASSAETMSLVLEYREVGSISGRVLCSTREGTNNEKQWTNPTKYDSLENEMDLEGAKNCYCQLSAYSPTEGESVNLTSPWVFVDGDFEGNEGCKTYCAEKCSGLLAGADPEDLAFRSAMLGLTTCPVDSGSGGSGSGEGGSNDLIKIATVVHTNNVFAPIENRLTNLITQVGNIVTTTASQASSIGSLLTGKQDRPDESCDPGETCLLVKDVSNVEHWYPIVTCGQNSFLSNVGNPTTHTFGTANVSDAACSNEISSSGCTSGENVAVWSNGVIFTDYASVPIAQRTPGSIVSLSSSELSTPGNVCVCNITGYRVLDNQEYATRQDVDTDKWFVAGLATGNSCESMCMRYMYGNGGNSVSIAQVKAYYEEIGNTCSASAQSATMCTYDAYMASLAASGDGTDAGGFVTGTGARWWECDPEGESVLRTSSHCASNSNNYGTWIMSVTNNADQDGYVYGKAGYVTVPAGTVTRDVINVTPSQISPTYDSSVHNAVVCSIEGYRINGNSSDTQLNSGKAIVGGTLAESPNVFSTNASNDNNAGMFCAEWMRRMQSPSGEVSGLYRVLGDSCQQ